jgi:hypothetical protein
LKIPAVRCGTSNTNAVAAKDLAHVLSLRPDLAVAKIADADETTGNTSRPSRLALRSSISSMRPSIWPMRLRPFTGDGTFTTRHKFEYYRDRLLNEDNGVQTVPVRAIHVRLSRAEVVV